MSHISLVTHPVVYVKRKLSHHRYYSGRPITQPVEKKINGVKFLFDPSLGSHIKKMYYGSYEFDVKEAMKKYLKPGGTFLDIGANIGYLSAIGAGFVGKTGVVHSFEPVPSYFQYLAKMAKLNSDYNIVVNNLALGKCCSTSRMTVSKPPAIGLSSMVPDFTPKKCAECVIEIPVMRLDEYIQKNAFHKISLIKIDVEGFEIPVLKGASDFFKEYKNCLPPIIVECTPAAYKQLNTSLNELDELMLPYGYKSYCLFGQHRVNIKKIERAVDILFKQ